jgi:hypothetical protein
MVEEITNGRALDIAKVRSDLKISLCNRIAFK